MKKAVLATILRIAKWTGLFALARRLTARDLRILCYHGGALRDEHRFSPGLFMSRETFTDRMDFLKRHRYPVLTLDQAIQSLERGDWPNAATVITIDDGWLGTYSVMAPVLKDYGFPATLYAATYYLERQTQVFNVAANYVLWRARDQTLDLAGLADGLSGRHLLIDAAQRSVVRDKLVACADSMSSAEERQELFRRVCAAVGLDASEIEDARICCFMNAEEAANLKHHGIDLQLHSHRHTFPADNFELARREIEDNRRALALLGGEERVHFCYPSGDYEAWQIAWLPQLGIRSATTIRGGFTRAGSSPFELRRFLDSERVSPLEFEAEMSGFFELIRRCGYAI
jgi:peptidoglycan/xylan/chitin deacetylase (PgdA/CDA1 family)